MPSSRNSGMMRGSRLRSHSEYSLCSAEIGCTACARRIVCSPASDKPEESHLPFAHELRHRADDVLDRHLGIDTMLIQQIDAIGLQTAERAFHSLANVRGLAVHPCSAAVLIDAESELGRDHEPVARTIELRESAREELLVYVRAVHLCRIEECHAELDGAVNRGDGLALVALVRGAVCLAHSHEAKAELGDGQALCAECAGSQHIPVVRLMRGTVASTVPRSTRDGNIDASYRAPSTTNSRDLCTTEL